MDRPVELTPEIVVEGYCRGVFPMADPDGRIRWYTADPRGIFPIDAFHIPGSLAQFMRSAHYPYETRINSDFEAVMSACMNCRSGATWINQRLIRVYVQLHRMGLAHSVETWNRGALVGGLYGVSLGGAFFGESMFHHQRDASKVALVRLVQRLRERGYLLLDTQTCTPHLARFGCIEIPARQYLRRLHTAIQRRCTFE